jgi:DUF1680 family protein
MYNGVIAGISLKGTEFFYPNPMESDGVYKFNMGACTRSGWFDCSCCPTNLIRFIPAIPGLIYAQEKETLFVNLYMSNVADVTLNSTKIKVSQETNYPWDGKVKMVVSPEKTGNFTVKMRVPGWARNEVLPGGLYSYAVKSSAVPSLSINGKKQEAKITDGYFILTRKWKKGDVVEVNFPMDVREVMASDKITEDRDKIALEYGPLVYTVEEADNADVDGIAVSNKTLFSTKAKPNLLRGITTIEGAAGNKKFVAIPYYTWSNRGIGKMKVWLPKKD